MEINIDLGEIISDMGYATVCRCVQCKFSEKHVNIETWVGTKTWWTCAKNYLGGVIDGHDYCSRGVLARLKGDNV